MRENPQTRPFIGSLAIGKEESGSGQKRRRLIRRLRRRLAPRQPLPCGIARASGPAILLRPAGLFCLFHSRQQLFSHQ